MNTCAKKVREKIKEPQGVLRRLVFREGPCVDGRDGLRCRWKREVGLGKRRSMFQATEAKVGQTNLEIKDSSLSISSSVNT